MRTKLIALCILVLPALMLLPMEHSIRAEQVYRRYGGAPVDLKMRDQMGQGMAIALLAGFRGVVADFLWIQNHGFWEKREWVRMFRNVDLVTTLQPQSVLFWDVSAWHIGWNVSYAMRVDPAIPTEAERIKKQRACFEQASELLQRGIQNLPNRYDLYFALGWIYKEKFQDHCKAAEYFGPAAEFEDAPHYVGREYARALERCGEVAAAYEQWKKLWEARETTPSGMRSIIERELKRMEDLLKIPDSQRVFPTGSAGAGAPS